MSDCFITNPFLEIKKNADIVVQKYLKEKGLDIKGETEPSTEENYGDLSSNIAFLLPKILKNSPKNIAEEIAKELSKEKMPLISKVESVNGYINFKVDCAGYAKVTMDAVKKLGRKYGMLEDISGDKIIVEHTSVNPNKPWHVGHARNAILGDGVSRLLQLAGYNVEIENYIDDTGKQVAETLFALEYYGAKLPGEDACEKTSAELGKIADIPKARLFYIKSERVDHFLGDIYVKLNNIMARKEKIEKLISYYEALKLKKGDEIYPEEITIRYEPFADDALHDIDEKTKAQSISEKLTLLEKEIDSIDENEIEKIHQGIDKTMHDVETGKYRHIVERCVKDQLKTAFRLGIYYDVLIWESDIVRSDLFSEAMANIRKSPYVYTAEDGDLKGCLVLKMSELTDAKGSWDFEADKVLIKSNGLPVYVAKDMAFMMWKFGLLERDMKYKVFMEEPNGKILKTTHPEGEEDGFGSAKKVINVIGIEQQRDQTAVRLALKITGYEKEFENSRHLAYEHVWLPEGKMSGRKGVWISTDEILTEAVTRAYNVIDVKRPELPEKKKWEIAEAVGVSAFRYALLKTAPNKKITFNWDDTLSLEGNSAPYLQYSSARISSMLKKAKNENIDIYAEKDIDYQLLSSDAEMNLIKHIAKLPETIRAASKDARPDMIADYAHSLVSKFTDFYHLCPVLKAETDDLRYARLELVKATKIVVSNVFNILGIAEVEEM